MDGDKITLTDEKGDVATVTIADVKQSNGVIHVIDTADAAEVLIPAGYLPPAHVSWSTTAARPHEQSVRSSRMKIQNENACAGPMTSTSRIRACARSCAG